MSTLREGHKSWDFLLEEFGVDRTAMVGGEAVTVSGRVRNAGRDIGTVYVITKIANSYDQKRPIYCTDDDVARPTWRLVDLKPGETRDFAVCWRPPSTEMAKHCDVSVELWNPPKLYRRGVPHLFCRSPWLGLFEISGGPSSSSQLRPSPRVFISYSYESEDHRRWVTSLGDELKKCQIKVVADYSDLHPGDDITHFMERGIRDANVVVLVCSSGFKRKADDRTRGSGVGFESAIVSRKIFEGESDKVFLAVLRDCGESPKLTTLVPDYLGAHKAIDMRSENWRAAPFQALLDKIRFEQPR